MSYFRTNKEIKDSLVGKYKVSDRPQGKLIENHEHFDGCKCIRCGGEEEEPENKHPWK